jgi:hypothetical protein
VALGDHGAGRGGEGVHGAGHEAEAAGGGGGGGGGQEAHHVLLVLGRAMEPPLQVGRQQRLHGGVVPGVERLVQAEDQELVALLRSLRLLRRWVDAYLVALGGGAAFLQLRRRQQIDPLCLSLTIIVTRGQDGMRVRARIGGHNHNPEMEAGVFYRPKPNPDREADSHTLTSPRAKRVMNGRFLPRQQTGSTPTASALPAHAPRFATFPTFKILSC